MYIFEKTWKITPYGCMVISLCIAQQGRGGRAQVGGYHRNWDHHTPKGELPMLFQRYTWHFDVSLNIYIYIYLRIVDILLYMFLIFYCKFDRIMDGGRLLQPPLIIYECYIHKTLPKKEIYMYIYIYTCQKYVKM